MLLVFLLCCSSLPSCVFGRDKCQAGQSCWPSNDDFRELGSLIDGDVYLRGDWGWDRAIKLKNPRLNIKPGVVVMAQHSTDVRIAVDFSVNRNLDLSIKSSGHCYSGNCMKLNSFHIDVSRLTNMTLDKQTMTLKAGAGIDFADMYKLCDSQGVLVVGGMCPTVHNVGFAAGGGHGPLIRSYGLGADNVVSLDLVTAAGHLIYVSAENNSDIFWAARGGGGGAYGIVVSMTLNVYSAPSSLVALSMSWPFIHNDLRVGEPILIDWLESIQHNLPDAWTFYTVSMKEAPKGIAPFIAPGFDSKTMDGVLNLVGLYNGPWDQSMLDSVTRLMQLGQQEQLLCKLKNFTSFKKWHDQVWFASEGLTPYRSYMASYFTQPELNASELARVLIDAVIELPHGTVNMQYGVQLGGKISRPDSASSVSADFRTALMMQQTGASWHKVADDDANIAWVNKVGNTIASMDGVRGAYLNEASPAAISGYEELFWGNNQTFKKLQNIKDDMDPLDTFECFQCVYSSNL